MQWLVRPGLGAQWTVLSTVRPQAPRWWGQDSVPPSPPGVAAFAAAHLLYLCAFGLTPWQPGLLLPVVLASAPYHCLLLLHVPPAEVLPLTAYALVLATVLWRGLARGGGASWGALLFTLSDAVLAWNTFAQPLPYGRLLVMAAYYAAQLLLTLTAFQSQGLKTS